MSEMPAALDSLSEASLATYCEAVGDAYRSAEVSAPRYWERCFRLAGATLVIRTTSERLLSPVAAALAHLSVERPPSVDLTVHLWDGASTTSPAPPSPLAWYARQHGGYPKTLFGTRQFPANGELRAFNSESVRTSFHFWPSALRVLHTVNNLGFYWIDDAANMPYYERVAPLRNMLSWWFSERDCLFAHGAAVGLESGGVLLVGDSGAGKSTAALACLEGGFLYAGDDYCVVSNLSDPFVHSLYSTAKLKGRADFGRFPSLASLVSNPDRLDHEKALFFLHSHFPERLAGGFPLRAILIPTFGGASAARIRPASHETALRAMAPSTVYQLRGTGRSAFQQIARLVRTVPAYILDVGPAVETIPAAIRRLLSERA